METMETFSALVPGDGRWGGREGGTRVPLPRAGTVGTGSMSTCSKDWSQQAGILGAILAIAGEPRQMVAGRGRRACRPNAEASR